MASKTEYEMLWKLGAQLGQDFNGTFSSAQKILTETQNEIQKLNKIQSDISAYSKQQQSIEKQKVNLNCMSNSYRTFNTKWLLLLSTTQLLQTKKLN